MSSLSVRDRSPSYPWGSPEHVRNPLLPITDLRIESLRWWRNKWRVCFNSAQSMQITTALHSSWGLYQLWKLGLLPWGTAALPLPKVQRTRQMLRPFSVVTLLGNLDLFGRHSLLALPLFRVPRGMSAVLFSKCKLLTQESTRFCFQLVILVVPPEAKSTYRLRTSGVLLCISGNNTRMTPHSTLKSPGLADSEELL